MMIMYGAPPAPGNNRGNSPVSQGPTVYTHPGLRWQRLQGTVQSSRGPVNFNFAHVLFTIIQQDGSVYIHAYSERNWARLDRPCSNPNMALVRIIDWARNYSLRNPRKRTMSYKTKPGYSTDDESTITSEVPDDEDGALAYASLEQTSWQLSINSSSALSSSVIATRSGVGRWIKIATAVDSAAFDFILGMGLDGSRTVTGTVAALTTSVNYTNLTVNPSGQLPCAGYPVICTGSLVMGANSVLRNDGSSVAANTQAGGNSAPAGEIMNTVSNGSSGGAISSAGSSVAGVTFCVGGAGGAGGSGVGAGGTIGANTPPSSILGRMLFHLGVLFRNSGSFTQIRAGQGGSGGGGGSASVGSGGGGGGGGCIVIAKSITMATGSRISARGGDGGSNSGVNAGGGGGGGGGLVIVMCDNLSIADSYASHFQSTGGSGGVASGGGNSGANGSDGRVFVFVRGNLVYSSP